MKNCKIKKIIILGRPTKLFVGSFIINRNISIKI